MKPRRPKPSSSRASRMVMLTARTRLRATSTTACGRHILCVWREYVPSLRPSLTRSHRARTVTADLSLVILRARCGVPPDSRLERAKRVPRSAANERRDGGTPFLPAKHSHASLRKYLTRIAHLTDPSLVSPGTLSRFNVIKDTMGEERRFASRTVLSSLLRATRSSASRRKFAFRIIPQSDPSSDARETLSL